MARLSRYALVLAALCGPSVAMADPITVVAALAPYIGGAAAAFVATYGATIAFVGYGLYSSAQARRKQRAQLSAARADYNASLQDRNVTVLNNEASRKVVYGSPAPVGGALVAMHTSGAKDEFKHLVVVFAAHECLAIDEIYLEGEPLGPLDGAGWAQPGSYFYEDMGDAVTTETVQLDGSGVGTTSKPIGGVVVWELADGQVGPSEPFIGTVSGNTIAGGVGFANIIIKLTYRYRQLLPRVNVQKHLSPGGVDTSDAFLASKVPEKWTAAHKLSGYTYLVVTLDLNFGRFQGGPPNITARIRGKKDIYDFRTGTTGFTNNAALCAADLLTSSFGMGATRAQIDTAACSAAANACDAQGFTCDGVIDTANARDANLAMIEDAMAGGTHFSGGVWRITAGAWATPVMSLTDATTLAGAIEVVQASQPRESRFNSVRGQFAPADGLGVTSDITPYSVASYVSLDGIAQVKDMAFPFTSTDAKCQKLAAIAVEQARLGLTISYPAHLACWKLQPGDRVAVDNTEMGFAAKTFRLVDWVHVPNAPLSLVLTEDAAAVYTGTFNVPGYQQATSNLADPWARPVAPGNLIAASGTNILVRGSDGTITTRVFLTWQASTQRSVLQGGYTQVQWRLSSATDDQWQSTDLPAEAASLYLTGPQDGTTILVRVRHVSGLGVTGLWSTIAHSVLGKTAPPAAPAFVKATQTLVFWGAVNELDLAGYRIRSFSGATGAVWSRGTPLHNDLLTTGPWLITGKLYGVQTIMVLAEDTTGNQSAFAFDVVDFGPPDAGNTVQTHDYAGQGFLGTVVNASVVAGSLVANADAASDRYALPDVYGEPDNYATSYLPLTWTSRPFLPLYGGGTLALSASIAGSNTQIEYQVDGSTLNDNYALADTYASADLYGPSSPFAAWPGAVSVGRMQGVIFRVSIDGGSQQGQVTAFAPSLVVPDVRQTFSDVAVPPEGLRLAPGAGTPARNWILIKSVQGTPYADVTAAIGVRIMDRSAVLGPLMQIVDYTGTPVAGRANFDIGGLADV